ncbi:hypothetical protein BDR07DRAFT_1497488 [Suillus spraguei]|nr:hypothetical protein BDR07DRAFT_1497488 [Suillus spraguei]
MAHLIADPTLEACPDFTSAPFHTTRTTLLCPTVNDAQAATMLQAMWTATNIALQTQWHQQLADDTLATVEQNHLLAEEDAQHLAAQKSHEAAVAKEDKKKNHIHYLPIPDRPRPKQTAQTVLVSDFALCKLETQYVELFYWTNKGLANAKQNSRTADDDSMVPMRTSDSFTTWTPASAARPASGIIADHLLDPLDFSHAIPCFINTLEHCGWDPSRISMLADFFGALMLHKYWSSEDLIERHTLLTYQEEQRHAWHQAIPQPAGA